MVTGKLQETLEAIRTIPECYMQQAGLYAQRIASSRHYTLDQIKSGALDLAARVALVSGCGGLVGLALDEPVRGAAIAALGEAVYAVSLRAIDFGQSQSKAWKALPSNERRVKTAFAELATQISYQTSSPILNVLKNSFYRTIVFSLGLLPIGGFMYVFAMGLGTGTAFSLYTHVKGGMLLRSLESR